MKIFSTLLFLVFCVVQAANACSPPPPNFEFRTTAEKVEGSGYVILGKRHLTGLRKVSGIGPSYNYDTGEPATADIEVIHVLKGHIEKKIITVQASFGMCGSAFLFNDDDQHIMLLRKSQSVDGTYRPNGGYNDSPDIVLRKNGDTGVYEVRDDTVAGYTVIEKFIEKYNLIALPTSFGN